MTGEPSFDDAFALHRAGRLPEAAAAYRSVLTRNETDADAHNLLGQVELALGHAQSALRHAQRAIELEPNDERYWLNAANVHRSTKNVPGAIECLTRALQVKPNYTEALVGRAQLLCQVGKDQDALPDLVAATRLVPHEKSLWVQLGRIALQGAKYDLADEAYAKVIEIDPNNVDAYVQRGMARHANGQFGAALADFGAASRRRPQDAQLHFLMGTGLVSLGRADLALIAFDQALQLDSNHAASLRERAHLLSAQRKYVEAQASYKKALTINPNDAACWNGLGLLCIDLNDTENAYKFFSNAINLSPQLAQPFYNRGQVLSELGRVSEALSDFEAAWALDKNQPFLQGRRFAAQLQLCDWTEYQDRSDALHQAILQGTAADTPLNTSYYSDSPTAHLAAAKFFAATSIPRGQQRIYAQKQRSGQKIRLGYLSADYHNHATAHLMSGLIERHNRDRFDVVALSFSKDDGSPLQQRIRGAFDEFIDIKGLSDEDAARRIVELKIDIAIDLKGYSAHCRPGILATRPAPVQMQYLGFPDTMGVDFIDYIIADSVVVPKTDQQWYTEKVIRLPGCYQTNDRSRPLPERSITRTEQGLPESSIVFCSFNTPAKLNPETFDVWMRILKRVNGSCLWLLAPAEQCRANLQREAKVRGIDPDRIVFASRADISQHIARHTCADIFLDTYPYNAHTTASDAMWAGVPIITRPGKTFAGRVCASLLQSAGLQEFIVPNWDSYERLAVELAQSPERLARAKQQFLSARDSSNVFNVDDFCRKLEHAYELAWERYCKGEPPDHIDF